MLLFYIDTYSRAQNIWMPYHVTFSSLGPQPQPSSSVPISDKCLGINSRQKSDTLLTRFHPADATL